MTESPFFTLSRSIRNRASLTTEPWSGRAYRGQAPASATKPYLVFSFASGVKPQLTPTRDARFVITIRCVSDDARVSEAGAARIIELYDDLGQNRAATLDLGDDWHLIHSQLRQYISIVENVDGGATQLFHDGVMIEFLLSAKAAV